ncbi:hypothetical protein OF83DRAFT_1084955 [Amylostereum chailletii]|nr:hypothetical protein OF83DRAFT_1084955 [Amylostereum chailletii]
MSATSTTAPRVAIVTGAARGIGRAIALRLAKDGIDVGVNDIPGTAVDEVVAEIRALGRKSCALSADVSDDKQVAEMVKKAVDTLGGIDIMVANAGIVRMTSFLDLTPEDFDKMLAVNTRGVLICYQHAARQMIAQGRGGRLIAIPYLTSYGASKFAVRGITQTAALELGEHGITVNCYAPGAVDTGVPVTGGEMSPTDLKAIQAITSVFGRAPVGRVAQPSEIAHLVSYLASEQAAFVTGQTISINGGSHLS